MQNLKQASSFNKSAIEEHQMSKQMQHKADLLRGMIEIEQDQQLKVAFDREQKLRK
jgi:hypothetical protein